MSESESASTQTRTCVSCGINISGTNAAAFPCPECGHRIYRDERCRKQSTLYECPNCGFMGP
jgi:predicted RNA-binding Zn-ribbon protein involved in translation (DUF1610 family)